MTNSHDGYFVDESGTIAFNAAFTRMLAESQKAIVSQYLLPENTLTFRHGGNWRHPGNDEAISNEMREHSATIETPFQDLIDNNLDAIPRCIESLSESMHQQFAHMLYSTVSEACDQNGNIVDAKNEASLTDAYIAMIEKIQFAANKNGEVDFPEIHANPEMASRIKKALEAAPPEFKERVEALMARKIEEALEREAERKAKFVQYGKE